MCYDYISFLVHPSFKVIKDSLSLALVHFVFCVLSVYLQLCDGRVSLLGTRRCTDTSLLHELYLLLDSSSGRSALTVARHAAPLLIVPFSSPIALGIPLRLSVLDPVSWIASLFLWCTPSFCWRMSSFTSSIRVQRRSFWTFENVFIYTYIYLMTWPSVEY